MLEAAIALLETGGEAAVRVDPVVDAASVTKPSLYHYFGDRDGLIVAAQAERYRRSLLYGMQSQREAIEQCQSREEFIGLVGGWMAEISGPEGEQRRRVRVDVLGSAATRPQLRAQTGEIDKLAASELGDQMRIAEARGWLSTRFDLDVAATWWFGMMNGRYLVEEVQTPLVRREWDAIATEVSLHLLFNTAEH